MSYARLRAELLAARDARQNLLDGVATGHWRALVFATTAIPGPDKQRPGSDALLAWGLGRLHEAVAHCADLSADCDALGPYALLGSSTDPVAVKTACLRIESATDFARLLDLDVYGADLRRIGRSDLGAPPRRCLACPEPAAECTRVQRHPMNQLLAHVNALLRAIGRPAAC